MKFRVAIVEDEQNHAKHLRGLVEKFAREKGEDIDVVHYTDGDEIASDYKADCDVILFDILMARMNGMDAARYIRKMDKEVVILFITTIAQFAIEGYGVGARGYLLKPVPAPAAAKGGRVRHHKAGQGEPRLRDTEHPLHNEEIRRRREDRAGGGQIRRLHSLSRARQRSAAAQKRRGLNFPCAERRSEDLM